MMAAIFASMVASWTLGRPRAPCSRPSWPNHARIAALEQFNCDTRLLVLDQPRGSAVLWPETGVAS